MTSLTVPLDSQAPGTGRVVISFVPTFGQTGQLKGNVYGVNAADVKLFLFLFIPDLGWYSASSCNSVAIQGTGDFSVDLSSSIMNGYATRFSAYLVPNALSVPCVQSGETIPFLVERNAVGRASIPRLPQYKTISFSGLDWYVKSAPLKVYPGPQFFVEDNASVDSLGRLHLKVSRCLDSWCAAEIFTKDRVGYGTYTFKIESQLNNLDPNITLGLFTWDELAAEKFHREWDIEFARWGNPNASFSAQYVVQPYTGPNNMYRFLMSPSTSSTHSVVWSPGQVGFASSAGTDPAFSRWNFADGASPAPGVGDARLHLNLYIGAGQAPSIPVDREVIISRVQYSPIGAEAGFLRTQDSTSYLTDTYSLPTDAASLGCSVQVESDSSWLTVAGDTLHYSVSQNTGPARSGNLILQSTSCNLALGRQVLTVNQAGLVCDPSFADPSTHVGFIDSIRSIFIRAVSPVCNWTLTPTAPWIKIVSNASGSGDANVQVAIDSNGVPNLRQGSLKLNNGKEHRVYQDSSETMFALSPTVSVACGTQAGRFGVSWISSAEGVEIRLNTPSGQLVGQAEPSGSVDLPNLTDGTLIYLLAHPDTNPSPRILASARAIVRTGDCTIPSISPRGLVNTASYHSVSIAPGSLATIFGDHFTGSTIKANSNPLPNHLGDIEVILAGSRCPISFVSPNQINFVVPANIPPGRNLLSVGQATAEVNVTPVSPGIFTISGNGFGIPFASVTAVFSDGHTQDLQAYSCAAAGCTGVPMSVSEDTSDLYVVLYGTGFRNLRNATASLGSFAAEVLYAGPQPQFPGLDQINLRITKPAGITGRQTLRIRTDGTNSNAVDLIFQ